MRMPFTAEDLLSPQELYCRKFVVRIHVIHGPGYVFGRGSESLYDQTGRRHRTHRRHRHPGPRAMADIVIQKIIEQESCYYDCENGLLKGNRLRVPQMTIRDGNTVLCQVSFNGELPH